MATEQARHMAELFASVNERTSKPGLDLATIRDVSERLHLCGTEPVGVTYAEVDADGVHALWCIPEGSDTDHVLIHCHNGGGVVFSIYTDRKAAGHLARATGVRVLVVDFGLAPEHPFPAQIDDVERVYQWLLAQGYRPENIVSSGHSIGGNFAVSLVVRLRDKGIALPGAILSISPWSDIEMKSTTLDSNARTDNLSRQQLESFREVWLAGTGVTWDDPRINLLYADLTGLPPTMVHYGTGEILAGEIIEFVQRAKHAGVDISLHTVPEGQHSFIMGAGRVPEADEAIEQMGRWVRSRLNLDDMLHSVMSTT